MSGSRRPGALITPDNCRIPSRTPGPVGLNDQGDPNITTLFGDTPSPVGLLDGADPILPQLCLIIPYTQMICIDPDGILLSSGSDLQFFRSAVNASFQYIALDEAQEIALKITTFFEGGKSMNYQALADDFDGQGTSFGLIQWNFGTNTLGPLLKKMLDKDETAFKSCFGDGANYETIKKALVDGVKNDQLTWARDRIKNKRSAWESAFKKIGSNDVFNKIQRVQAADQYHPEAIDVIKAIRAIAPSLLKNIELRSYVAIFDLCVQQGSIKNAITEIKKRIVDEKPTSQLEVMKIVVTERARKAKNKWVSDCLSRRMGILTSASYKSTEHEVKSERKNPQFSLITESGGKYVTGL
mgnify:CR=1 FL=1